MLTSLVLDDEPSIRTLIRAILSQAGFHTLEAEDGARGLEIMRQSGGAVDLVVTDIKMPDVDGITFACSVRQSHPRVRIILVSGYSDGEASLQFDGFVQKPFRVNALLEEVHKVMRERINAAA